MNHSSCMQRSLDIRDGIGAWLPNLVIRLLLAYDFWEAGNGHKVCDNSHQLPLICLVLFLPLLFLGPRKLSLDHGISKLAAASHRVV